MSNISLGFMAQSLFTHWCYLTCITAILCNTQRILCLSCFRHLLEHRVSSALLIWDFNFTPRARTVSFGVSSPGFRFALFQKWWATYICKLWMRVWKERTGRDCSTVRIPDSHRAPARPSTHCRRGSSSRARAAVRRQPSCRDTTERRAVRANWYAFV